MFYLVTVFRTSSLRDSISSDTERTVLGVGEELGYVEVCDKEQVF